MEEWREIDEFPGYSVSEYGFVRNDETNYQLAILVNQHGVANVGLTKDRVQHKRSVALLVATAFLTPHPLEAFDTPINLDGDRRNNRVDNLMWRPRPFAIKYHNQFDDGKRSSIVRPLQDISTKEVYENSMEAAMANGLLDREIFLAIVNHTYVWPTFQRFRVLADTR